MTTISKTTQTDKAKFEVSLTRQVADHVANLDGDRITTGREIYERYHITITRNDGARIWATGKPGEVFMTADKYTHFPTGAYARLGDSYVSKPTYDLCMGLMAELDAELPKTDEQIAIEAAQAAAEARADAWLNSKEYRQMVELERRMDDPNSDL